MLNQVVLTEAGIEYSAGVARFMGNSALYEKMLLKFLEDGSFYEAQKQLKASDDNKLLRCVHTLKGIAGNLSISRVYAVATDMVSLIREGEIERAKVLFPRLEEEYETAVSAIKRSSM